LLHQNKKGPAAAMDIDFCSYHYKTPATWRCRTCRVHYGDCCVTRASARAEHPRCITCTHDLWPLGAANSIEPFWNVLHKFLAYPFKPGPLMLTFFLGLVAMLIAPSLPGAAAGLFILVVCARYAYAIIEHTSMGRIKPPGLTILFTRDPDSLFLKQIAVILVAGFAMAAANMTGSVFIALLMFAFVTVAVPASILVLAVEKKLAAAVNPLLLTNLMMKMGSGYLVLYVFLQILGGGPYYIFQYFSEWIPEGIYLPAYVSTTIYFTFASAHMMGYALLQYQKELGYRAELEEESVVVGSDNRINPQTVNQINLLLIEGRYDEAYDLVKRSARQYPDDLVLQQRYHRLMAERDMKDELRLHSGGLIERLVAANSIPNAAAIFVNTVRALPEFKPESANTLHRFAELFENRNQHRNAASMLLQIAKHYPDYKEMPRVWLKIAQLCALELQQPEKAKQAIMYIMGQDGYPPEIKQEADKLLKIINN
jgi:tetratricopeptide (TPR) repeat protein